mgnify:CR=1 FL=1
MLSLLPFDLTLEIFCKLKYNNLDILLIDKKFFSFYKSNEKRVCRNIINSYHLLVTKNHIICITILIRNGANFIDDPFVCHQAIENNCTDGLIFLLKNGCNLWGFSHQQFVIDVYHGNLEIIKILVDNGFNYRRHDNFLLLRAIAKGYFGVVEFLCNSITPMEIQRQDNLLLWIASSEYLEIIKLLIEKGADPASRNWGVLYWAAHDGELESVRYFLMKYNCIVTDDMIDAAVTNGYPVVSKLLKEYHETQEVN